MTNAAILGAILLVLAWAYRRAYMDGLLLSTFFLLLLPNTIALNLGLALPVLNAHRVILILTFVFWLRNRDLPKRILSFPFARAFLAIIAAMAVSTVLADEFLVSFKRFLYFSLETVLYYFILFSSLRDESDCRRLLEVVLYSLTAVALLGIVQRFTRFDFVSYFGEVQRYEFQVSREGNSRDVFSTYPHRILFGAAMAIGSMLALTSVIEGRRRIAWAVLPLLAAALYFSFSRGPWLAMIVCLAVVGLLVDRRFLKAGAVLALAAVVVFVARPGTWGTIQSLYHSTFDEQSIKGSSFQWRFLVLERSLESILGASEPERALFGHGEGSHLYLEHVPVLMSTGHYGTFVSWDNEFAVLLYERGILGFLPTLFIDGLFFLGSLRFLRAHPGHPSGVAFLSIFLILVFMSTNVKMFAPQLVYLQGIALAGGMSLARGGSGGR